MKLQENAKRACIYFIYDKDGVIDRYILHQLRAIKQHVEFLHCVINGILNSEGDLALREIADEVYVRENKGNDIGAYRAAIQHIGWEILSSYDELVMMNFTCFGPVYSLQELFAWANNQDVDFWGLTWDHKTDWLETKRYLHYNECELHFQSYFLAFRKPLLGSQFLKKFYEEIPEDTSYAMSGCVYEYAFPGYFEKHGYQWTIYCDTTDDYNYPLLHNPVHLLKKYRIPFFKKRNFYHHYTDVLNNTAGEATLRLLDFVEHHTDYDLNLVWESVLRSCSLSDVVRNTHLYRILSKRDCVPDNKHHLSVGLVFYAHYEDLFEETISYLQHFPNYADILLMTNSEEKKANLEMLLHKSHIECEVVVIENRGRDVSALLVAGEEFVSGHDLVCFAHDKKTLQILPHSVGRSWRHKLYENLFPSPAFVENVVSMFEREPRLGIAFPAYPNHNAYAVNLGTGWGANFQKTKELLRDFGVHVKIDQHALCVAPLGTCFWFRREALSKLFAGYQGRGWDYRDFPREPNGTDGTLLHAVEHAYAYFAQAAGYYPAYLYNDEYARIDLTNLEFEKIGSIPMHKWMDEAVMAGIYGTKLEPESTEAGGAAAPQLALEYDRNFNFGIRESLRHLAIAIRCRYPRLWGALLPVRRLGQKLLGIKTK